MGNAQDDPGLFITAIASNIADQRYLPFENAGAVSSWHLEMPQMQQEVDLSTVGDVVLHLYYTALDGGATFQNAVQAYNANQSADLGHQSLQRAERLHRALAHGRQSLPAHPVAGMVATPKTLFNGTAMQTDGTQRWEVFNNTALVNPIRYSR